MPRRSSGADMDTDDDGAGEDVELHTLIPPPSAPHKEPTPPRTLPRRPSGLGPRPHSLGAMSVNAFCSILANRFLLSRAYLVIYASMILLSLFVIGWTLVARGGYPENDWFVASEILINVALVCEVVIRMVSSGLKYWRIWTNVFDFFVMVLCVLGFVVYLRGPSMAEEVGDLAATTLVMFRYGLQYVRLVVFLKNQRQRSRAHATVVDFSRVPDMDSDLLILPPLSGREKENVPGNTSTEDT